MTNERFKRAVGTFPTRQDAEIALEELKDAGFDMNRVSAIAQKPEGEATMGDVEVESVGDRAKHGAGAGAVMGAATGGILGLIGSFSVLAIPGIGVATELGVLLGNALLGGGVGAAGGGLFGALLGWGVSEEDAKYYNELLSEGSYIILVEGTQAEINGAAAILLNRQICYWNVYDAPGNTNLTGV